MKYSESELVLKIEDQIPGYFVSLNGQVKFYTLASMLLESAGKHAERYGFGYHDMIRHNVYWVLSRFHIKMLEYPMMNEPVLIETWPKGPERLFFMRDYRMSRPDGTLLALGTTAWLILDGQTGRPRKMETSHELQEFRASETPAIEELPGKLPSVHEADLKVPVTARYSDLDINKHVNALKYIEWIQDCYGEDTYLSGNILELQINYQLETRFGEVVEVRMRKAVKGESFDHFEGIRKADGNSAFRARVRFGNI